MTWGMWRGYLKKLRRSEWCQGWVSLTMASLEDLQGATGDLERLSDTCLERISCTSCQWQQGVRSEVQWMMSRSRDK